MINKRAAVVFLYLLTVLRLHLSLSLSLAGAMAAMVLLLSIFCRFMALAAPGLAAEVYDAELLLKKIKPALAGAGEDDNVQLSSWNTTVPLCLWRGLEWSSSDGTPLSCSGRVQRSNLSLAGDRSLQLTALRLPAAGLAGVVPPEIGEFSSLRSLILGVNNLSGSFPLELGNSPELAELDISGNSLAGPLPPSIWNLCGRLVSLRLHGNNLAGSLPKPADSNTSCDELLVLDLGENRFSGQLPDFLAGFRRLEELDLSGNLFSGDVPSSLAELTSLVRLNLSENNFTGRLPAGLGGRFAVEGFLGNSPGLCGPPLGECRDGGGVSAAAPPKTHSSSGGIVAGTLIGAMAGVVAAGSLIVGWMQGRRRRKAAAAAAAADEEEIGVDEAAGEGKLVVFAGGEHLTMEDVLNATGQVMEKTVYGTVYKAKLADGGTIALRLLREGSCLERAACLPAIRLLGRARHENLVSLRAFYEGSRGEKLLIYDYFPNRTLDDLLHEARAGRPILDWARRHKIATGVARGLAYLHSEQQQEAISHGNLCARSVLVDELFVPRLTEYGVYRLLAPAVAGEMLAGAKVTGYRAPELQRMKRCCARTDVFSFGILLLELLMGKRPGREAAELPELVKMAVLEETTAEIFDPEVLKAVRPMEDGLIHALKLAMGCCSPVPSVRPDMAEVVRQLEENRPRPRSSTLYSPADSRSEAGTPF